MSPEAQGNSSHNETVVNPCKALSTYLGKRVEKAFPDSSNKRLKQSTAFCWSTSRSLANIRG